MIFRPMRIEDVDRLKLDEDWIYDRFRYYMSSELGPAYIAEENGRPLCAFGALFEWGHSGACEVWFNLIEKDRSFNISRILKRMITGLAEQYKITRMQAVVKCSSEINNRFMKFLGFVNETPDGMKNKLHNGQTAYLYSRCF